MSRTLWHRFKILSIEPSFRPLGCPPTMNIKNATLCPTLPLDQGWHDLSSRIHQLTPPTWIEDVTWIVTSLLTLAISRDRTPLIQRIMNLLPFLPWDWNRGSHYISMLDILWDQGMLPLPLLWLSWPTCYLHLIPRLALFNPLPLRDPPPTEMSPSSSPTTLEGSMYHFLLLVLLPKGSL